MSPRGFFGVIMNRLNTSVALAALAAFFMAAPAVAADVAPPPPEAYNWTGFHIGAGGGGTFAFADEGNNDAFIETLDGFLDQGWYEQYGRHSGDLGDASFFGTIEAGFDYQLGSSIVAGILANYDFNSTKMKNTSNADVYHTFIGEDFTGYTNGSFETEYKVGDSWAIGGRLGFLAMDNALLYILAGYTEANIKAESTLESNGYPNLYYHNSESGWQDGWFVGGGIEALLWDNISLKAEYRYADYGKIKDSGEEFESVEGIFDQYRDQEADITVHTVRAVLSYRFGLF